jgi:heme exporter protein B
MRAFRAIISRDLALNFKSGAGLGTAIGFTLAVIVLFPLSLGPDQNLLQRLAPGIVWITLLLAILLTADRIYQQDFEDGTLDVMATGTLSFEGIALAKTLGHFLSTSLPLAIITPPLALMLNLNPLQLLSLMLAMCLAAFPLSAIAAMGGAITVGLRRGGLLAALLVLPLYIPVLIFGIAATQGAASPSGATPALIVLLALNLFLFVIHPFACAAALRAFLR